LDYRRQLWKRLGGYFSAQVVYVLVRMVTAYVPNCVFAIATALPKPWLLTDIEELGFQNT